jgi:hypothetical protein
MSRPAILGPWRHMNLNCGFSQVGVSVSTVMNPLISRHFCASSNVSCKMIFFRVIEKILGFSFLWIRDLHSTFSHSIFLIPHSTHFTFLIPHSTFHTFHISHCTFHISHPTFLIAHPTCSTFRSPQLHISTFHFSLNFEDTICVFFNSGIFLLLADLYGRFRRQQYSRWKYKMMKKATSI